MYGYSYNRENNFLTVLARNGKRILDLPLNVRFNYNGQDHRFKSYTLTENEKQIVISEKHPTPEISEMRMSLSFLPDCVLIEFEADAKENFAPYETELFRVDSLGIKMIDCLNWFTPQPRNYDGINRAFNKRFCSCSFDGYFTPPPLNFSVGNINGWVSFGLLDLPNSYHYNMNVRLGIVTEKPAGQILVRKGETYKAPRMILTFPEDEYEGITLYRKKLCDFGIIEEKKNYPEYPDWWKRPFVVTYGDEMMEIQHNWFNDDDLDSDAFCEDWLYMWLERAEKKLGNTSFNIMVDALWQYRYIPDAIPDEKRFPDFRGFIEHCHAKGHKVILWSAPLLCNTGLPVKSIAEKYDMLAKESMPGYPEVKKIDFTSDNAPKYFEELCEKYFGTGEGCLNCDGLKLDFFALFHKPEETSYKNPENGIGMKEMYRFHKLFADAARKVKPDVLINASTCDPRFEDIISMNRLHDIQKVYTEREIRARISALACPTLLIDSDGAIMISDWVKETYISAVLYSTPSLYYVNVFHDSISLSDEDMLSLGTLLRLSEKKQAGTPKFISEGNWRLMRGDETLGASFDGDTVLIFSDDGFAYLFTWREGEHEIPFFGKAPIEICDEVSFKNGVLKCNLKAGAVCKIKFKS